MDSATRQDGEGDARAAERNDALYEEVLRRARAAAVRTVDYATADDIAQDVAIACWQLPEAPARLDAWIAKCVRVRVLTHLRERARAQERAPVLEDEAMRAAEFDRRLNPELGARDAELERLLADVLRRVPRVRLETWLQVREGELTYAELSKARGVSRDAIRKHVVRINELLRAALGPHLHEGKY